MSEGGGCRGQLLPHILADQKALTGSGGAPHYYMPPRFLDFATCLEIEFRCSRNCKNDVGMNVLLLWLSWPDINYFYLDLYHLLGFCFPWVIGEMLPCSFHANFQSTLQAALDLQDIRPFPILLMYVLPCKLYLKLVVQFWYVCNSTCLHCNVRAHGRLHLY